MQAHQHQGRLPLGPGGCLSRGDHESPLLPLWGHSQCGVPHGEQQHRQQDPHHQRSRRAGGPVSPGAEAAAGAPEDAADQGQRGHADFLAGAVTGELSWIALLVMIIIILLTSNDNKRTARAKGSCELSGWSCHR